MESNKYPLTIKDLAGSFAFSATIFGILLSIKTPLLWSLSISAILFLVLLIIALQVQILLKKDNSFSFIRGEEGRELYKSIKSAKKSIVTTAFSADKPTQEYIDLLLKKLDEGVAVTRLITKSYKENPEYKWINKFKKKKHYVERVLDDIPFPFDVYIFDGKITKIYFPVSCEHDHYKDGVKFDSHEIASKFKVALDKSILHRCI